MDSRYAYAVGYIRALENKLLPRHIFQQLAASEGEAAFLRTLEATPYSGAGAGGLPAFLEEKGRELSALVKKLMVDDLLKEIAGLPYDYYNLSALLSAKGAVPGIQPFLYEERGSVETRALKEAVFENRYRHVPEHIAAAIERAEKVSADFENPALIAVAAEREYFHALDEKCARAGGGFFAEYSAGVSDVYNLATFFRVRLLGAGAATLKAALSEAGSIRPAVYSAWHKAGFESIPAEIARSPYGVLAEKGEECIREGKSLAAVEAMGDGIIFSLLARAGMVVMGPEPVLAYNIRKEHEMKLLRIISAGVRASSGAGMINERIYLPS